MLDTTRCEEYLAQVRAFADTRGLAIRADLEERLHWLGHYACPEDDPGKTKCVLMKDFAAHSFEFTMLRRGDDGEYRHYFVGGLIYFGKGENGVGPPQLSVRIGELDEGWSVHT